MRIRQAMMLTGVLVLIAACAGDSLAPGTGPEVTDAALFTLGQPDSSWAFFKRSSTPITRASAPHPESRALVRYNARAASQLDASGRVKRDAAFPDSSVIVKELSNGTSIATYAIMMKLRGSASAGANGWVWAEYGAGGAVRYSTTGRGGGCASCHAAGIDYTRMNDSHP